MPPLLPLFMGNKIINTWSHINLHMELEPNTFYQHRYGGVYKLGENFLSLSTIDLSRCVIYEHIFPFNQTYWHRPYDEFVDGRFTKLTDLEANAIINQDANMFKEIIRLNKEASKKS
jgi:hypothetical protein